MDLFSSSTSTCKKHVSTLNKSWMRTENWRRVLLISSNGCNDKWIACHLRWNFTQAYISKSKTSRLKMKMNRSTLSFGTISARKYRQASKSSIKSISRSLRIWKPIPIKTRKRYSYLTSTSSLTIYWWSRKLWILESNCIIICSN